MKYPFFDLFQENPDGSLKPRKSIYVNGVTFTPDVVLGPGISFAGLDFQQYKYWDIEADLKDEIYFIKGFYRPTYGRTA